MYKHYSIDVTTADRIQMQRALPTRSGLSVFFDLEDYLAVEFRVADGVVHAVLYLDHVEVATDNMYSRVLGEYRFYTEDDSGEEWTYVVDLV